MHTYATTTTTIILTRVSTSNKADQIMVSDEDSGIMQRGPHNTSLHAQKVIVQAIVLFAVATDCTCSLPVSEGRAVTKVFCALLPPKC
jgi:uncharacterized Fe-S cluster-containing MiaB family protein